MDAVVVGQSGRVRKAIVVALIPLLGACKPSASTTDLSAAGLTWHEAWGRPWAAEAGGLVAPSAGEVRTREVRSDVTVDVDVEHSPVTRNVYIGLREQESEPAKSTGYEVGYSTTQRTLTLSRWENGVGEPLASAENLTVGPKNHVRFRASGSRLTVEWNGGPVASADDTTYPSGRISLRVDAAEAGPSRFSALRVTP